jgi:hypothetical protein
VFPPPIPPPDDTDTPRMPLKAEMAMLWRCPRDMAPALRMTWAACNSRDLSPLKA